jgi:hypothetical protein
MTSETILLPDQATQAQKIRLTDWTWEGATVVEHTRKVADLYSRIPTFSRHPFRVGSEENRFKDEIRREPLRIIDEPLPVATVTTISAFFAPAAI